MCIRYVIQSMGALFVVVIYKTVVVTNEVGHSPHILDNIFFQNER